MFDKDLTNMDEATLMYAIGYDGSHQSPDDVAAEGYASPADDGSYLPDITAWEDVTDAEDAGGQDSSWRETVQTEDAGRFRRKRTHERNMRAMSKLWNRLFPVDYDALPMAEYVTVDESGVPSIPFPQAADASGFAPDGLSATDGAVVAGLGLAGLTDGIASDVADGMMVDGGKTILQSDTSNRDTIMIGNSALSDALANIKSRAGKHWKTDDAEWAEGVSEERTAPDEQGDADSEVIGEQEEPESLPEELSTLYDEAITMFSEIEETKPNGDTPEDEEFLGTEIDQYELENGDVSFPADGDTIESASVSEDYRSDAEQPDIYESEEWKEIEQEIKESQEAVKVGLEQLDLLAGVDAPVADDQEAPIAQEPHDEQRMPGDMLEEDLSDEQDIDEELDELEQDAQLDEEPIGSDYSSMPDEPVAIEETVEFSDVTEPVLDEMPEVPEVTDGQGQQERPSFFSKVLGMFRKPTYTPDVAEFASEGMGEVTSAEQEGVTDTDGIEDGDVTQPLGMQGAEPAVEPIQPEFVPRDEEPEEQDGLAALAEGLLPSEDVGSAHGETSTRASDDADQLVWESVSAEEHLAKVGEDYRSVNEPEDPNITDELRRFGNDDDIIVMKDDEEASDDYRKEAATGYPTMPMSPEELPAGADVQGATQPIPGMGADSPEPPAHIDAPQSVTQRIRIEANPLWGVSKSRLRSLEIDASPELMLPLPTSRNGQIDANIKVKTTEFLNPKRKGVGARSSHVKLSVRPSKVRRGAVSVLPAGTGYVPVRSPMGSKLKEQGKYDYEPIRRIGEALSDQK